MRSGKNTGAFRMSFLIFYSPPVVWKVKMAEDDIAFLLNRGELVEPHENEQAEVNAIEII